MTNKISLVLSVISIALLQACGGGGGDSDSMNVSSTGSAGASTSSTSSTSTGSVSAAFNHGATARFHLMSVGSQLFGGPNDSTIQEANGAMTTLGPNVLSGNKVVKEISGDTTYAMGRWTAGTVTNSSGATVMVGTGNQAYHYVAFNVPGTLPTSGTLTCGAGTFTAPTYTGGGVGTGTYESGTTTGAVTVTFGPTGASVGGNVSVTAAGSSGSIALKPSGVIVNGTPVSGNFFSNGDGAYFQVGDAGSGAYFVVGSYAVVLANGARYIGVARFRCS